MVSGECIDLHLPPLYVLTFCVPTGDTMTPLDDYELRLWAMRAGLTHDDVRCDLDAHKIP